MRDGTDQCAMEFESGMEGLLLPEPERVQKPKRKWDPDMELTWKQKAVLVLDICREQLAGSYPEPEGCSVVPTSFFYLAKEYQADGSSSGVQEQSTGGSNKLSNSSIDDAASCAARKLLNEMMRISELHLVQDGGDQEMSDDDKLEVLHVVRCQGFTEHDPKYGWDTCTRFSRFNLAFFDIDEESKVGLGPPVELSALELSSLESSINVISLKIVESDLGYPINVFGTVIARDEVDYRCVYLFKRDREDPQLINSPDDVLILTGPNRGLAVSGVMFFEYNLKIRCDGTEEDKTLSKGAIEFNTAR